jgi:nicotinate-nucleotide adenylyltransferase
MTVARRIGLLGGTFDPIHVGHMAAAAAARTILQLDEVLLLTSHVPPHRLQPAASVHHRFAMVALAAQDDEALRASDIELLAPGPSYTAATLQRLHAQGYSPSQLFFITGADAFAEIATWRHYPAFLSAAHFVVVDRPGRSSGSIRDLLPALAPRMRDASPAEVLSVGVGIPTAVFLVNQATPDVSSTGVRHRCADGQPITGLVPPAVERHIHRHALYRVCDAGASPAGGECRPASLLHEQEHL